MTLKQRVTLWAGIFVFGAAIIGLGVYFYRVGLDKADKLGSIFGCLIALTGLGISIFTMYQSRPDTQASDSPKIEQIQKSGNNSLSMQAGRDIKIGKKNQFNKRRRS